MWYDLPADVRLSSVEAVYNRQVVTSKTSRSRTVLISKRVLESPGTALPLVYSQFNV